MLRLPTPNFSFKLCLAFVAICVFSFVKPKIKQSPDKLQSASPFPIGAAVNPYLLQNNAGYRQVIDSQFNSITAENVLKWAGVHPAENTFDFSKGDILADYAIAHHKRFHGHNLCWYQYNPKWLSSFQGDSAAWEKLFKTHIQTVASHYKGKATSWDVVHEAFHNNGTLRVESADTDYRKDTGCIWARHIGKDYIARAFIYAHEADPDALLFYNDYDQEINPAKLNAIIAMVNDFRHRGVPINGLGLQMHINLNTPLQGITNAIKQFAATGLKIHIAELDISVNPKSDPNIVYSEDVQAKQSAMYAFVVQQYKALVPPQQQYGITTWNVGDADSWIRGSYHRKDWPLLFDDSYGKKNVYYAFLKALKQ
jgi:endo-1,4-beta-xylanase